MNPCAVCGCPEFIPVVAGMNDSAMLAAAVNRRVYIGSTLDEDNTWKCQNCGEIVVGDTSNEYDEVLKRAIESSGGTRLPENCLQIVIGQNTIQRAAFDGVQLGL